MFWGTEVDVSLDTSTSFKLPFELLNYVLLHEEICDFKIVSVYQVIRNLNKLMYQFCNSCLQRMLGHYVIYDKLSQEFYLRPLSLNKSAITSVYNRVNMYYIRKNNYPHFVAAYSYPNYSYNTTNISHVNNVYHVSKETSTIILNFDKYYNRNSSKSSNKQLLEKYHTEIAYKLHNNKFVIERISYNDQDSILFQYVGDDLYYKTFSTKAFHISLKEWNEFLENDYIMRDGRNRLCS